jgi:hypothetical protein
VALDAAKLRGRKGVALRGAGVIERGATGVIERGAGVIERGAGVIERTAPPEPVRSMGGGNGIVSSVSISSVVL